MTRVKMTPFTYSGMKVKVLVNITKPAPFDNEFFVKAGEIAIVTRTFGDFHYVKVGNSLPVRVKISDTAIAY